jgi:tetratricopeptide (TPR) repeat protein
VTAAADNGTATRAKRLLSLLAGLLAFFSGALSAQPIERVDVERSGPEAEIRIRFTTTIQYLRHFPATEGEFIRVILQFTATGDSSVGRVILDSRTPPTGGLVPRFTVSWPEEGGTLGVRFAERVHFRVRPGPDGRSLYVYVPLPAALQAAPAVVTTPEPAPTPPPAAPPTAAPAPTAPPPTAAPPPEVPPTTAAQAPAGPPQAAPPVPADIERQARELMEQGRRALQNNNPQAATDALNRLLNLPPNSYSQEAQEVVGVARERNGEFAKARAEYELYLKLYPQGDGARRVRERLAALPAPGAAPAAGRRVLGRPEKTEVTVTGGISQNYYHGSTKFDATIVPPTPGLKFDQVSLTATDQNSLISSVDLFTRMRGPDHDSKFVFRDIHTANFLAGQSNTNRLNSLYYERQNADASLLGRIGRQPGFTGGLQGTFDGLWAGYTTVPGLRLNGVVGRPVEFFAIQRKNFAGFNADLGPFMERWNANVFFMEQHVDSRIDRRAIGNELRYFDARRNLFALFDYDLAFRALNIAMLQANLIGADGSSTTFLADRRRVPVLQLTNALPGETATIAGVTNPTIRELFDAGRSLEELRNAAKALTPTSTLILVGHTRPVTPTLQLGADVRISEVSGTEASGNLPESPGTGTVYVYGAQAIKSKMFTETDTGVASLNLIDGATLKGTSLALNYVFVYELWRADAALRLYRQRSNLDVLLVRTTPSLRLSYRFRDNISFEAEVGTERSTNTGPTQTDRTVRKYFSIGYRWDLL